MDDTPMKRKRGKADQLRQDIKEIDRKMASKALNIKISLVGIVLSSTKMVGGWGDESSLSHRCDGTIKPDFVADFAQNFHRLLGRSPD